MDHPPTVERSKSWAEIVVQRLHHNHSDKTWMMMVIARCPSLSLSSLLLSFCSSAKCDSSDQLICSELPPLFFDDADTLLGNTIFFFLFIFLFVVCCLLLLLFLFHNECSVLPVRWRGCILRGGKSGLLRGGVPYRRP